MTADTPAASKDAPTDEAVMVNIAGNAQDLERAKEHARLLLKRVAAGPVGDGLSHAEYALLCLYAHVATLTAKLEAERVRADSAEKERDAACAAYLEKGRAAEAARADAAVAEAKALREVVDKFEAALDEAETIMRGEYGQVEFDLIQAARDARATLAQPAAGGAT